MKTFISILLVVLFIAKEIAPQVVFGKLVDENGAGLAEVQLQLYATPNVYNATSSSNGTFSFNIITGVEDNQLPTGYSVSDNFPNPFNPRTRIGITLPNRENVKVEVFNLLGQSVADVIEETFNAGTNYIDIELNGQPNGFYISRITIGDKYSIVKKLMLIYGSQHLITSGSTLTTQLNKPNNTFLETNLDSLIATSAIIGRKIFTSLPSFVSGTLDLGNLTIERYCPDCPTVLYEGKIYHTVQIGSQCWFKENLNVGVLITGSQEQSNNGVIEKYCYNDDTLNCTIYGGLYQWNEAMQYVRNEGTQGICPPGWHIPTNAELITLYYSVNNDGNALKEVGQGIDYGAGTNTSGFSALLGGYRDYNGSFSYYGYTFFYCSTESETYMTRHMQLKLDNSLLLLGYGHKGHGLYVRCIKD